MIGRVAGVSCSGRFLLSLVFLRGILTGSSEPIFSLGSCGDFMEDARYAVVDVVVKVAFEAGVFDDILPTTNFSVRIRAVQSECDDPSVAKHFIPLLTSSSEEDDATNSTDASIENPIVAMLGCSCTANTQFVARLTQSYAVPMVSGMESLADFFSTSSYTYFVRTALRETLPGTMLGTILSTVGWGNAIILHNENEVSNSEIEAFELATRDINLTHVGVPRSHLYTDEDGFEEWYATLEEVREALEHLLEGTVEPTAIVSFATDQFFSHALLCMSEALGITQNYSTYLLAEEMCEESTMFWTDSSASHPIVALAGLEDCASELGPQPSFEGALCPRRRADQGRRKQILTFLESLTCTQLYAAGLEAEFPCADNLFEEPEAHLLDAANWSELFDATSLVFFSLAKALEDFEGDLEEVRGQHLYDEMFSADYYGLSGLVRLTSAGERDMPFDIYQLQYEADDVLSFVEVGTFHSGSETLESLSNLRFKGNTSTHPVRTHCAHGEEWASLGEGCTHCGPGTYHTGSGATSQCLPCSAGTFKNESMSSCDVCEAGYYCPEGSEDMQPCGAGHFCLRAASEPTACHVGKYAWSNTSESCASCPVGTFTDLTGQSGCTTCPDHLTTHHVGTEAEDECICPEGTYEPLASLGEEEAGGHKICLACPTAMLCEEPNTTAAAFPAGIDDEDSLYPYPHVEVGYMTLQSNSIEVWKCKDEGWCPGGRPANCLEGHDPEAIGCGRCLPGWTSDSDGDCTECTGSGGQLLLVLGFLVFISGLVAFSILVSRQKLMQTRALVTCVVVAGLSVSSVQALGLFSTMTVTWVAPLKGIMTTLHLFTLDLKLLQVDCSFGVDTLSSYALNVSVPMVAVTVISLTLVIRKCFVPSMHCKAEIVNAVGTIFQLGFVSLAMLMAKPFICFSHPTGGYYSMASSPSILCYHSGEHTGRAITGICGFLFLVLPFSALLCWATFRHRKALRNASQSNEHLRMFRFLFSRFNAESYYYGLVVLFRSSSFSAVPIAASSSVAAQVLLLVMIILGCLLVQQNMQPWRSVAANRMEAGVLCFLVALLTCAAMGTDFSEAGDEVIGFLGCGMGLTVAAAMFFSVSNGLRQWLMPRMLYHWFISHHRRDAAGQARYLQHVLQLKTGKRCFLDCDHPMGLDSLFEIIRTNIGEIVVYLTGSTLRRPWCAGEITISYLTHKRAVAVTTPFFLPPDEQEYSIEELPSFLDGNRSHLITQGIGLAEISDAYRWLLGGTVRTVPVSRKLVGRDKLDVLVFSVLGTRVPGSRRSQVQRVDENGFAGALLVVSDPNDDEATAATGVLISKVQTELAIRGSIGAVLVADLDREELERDPTLAERVAGSPVIINVLSQHSLRCKVQLQITEHIVNVGKEMVPVITSSFKMPREDGIMRMISSHFGETDGTNYSMAIGKLLSNVAVVFSIDSTVGVLDAQAAELLLRLPSELGAALGAPRTSSMGGLPSIEEVATEAKPAFCSSSTFNPCDASDHELGTVARDSFYEFDDGVMVMTAAMQEDV